MIPVLSTAALGFALGMQHATDADHVVAVTTIVSRERSVLRASRVGALWGVGHTLTILLVGGALLLFRVTVAPHVGLAMELAVAVMLVGLGIANLFPARGEAPHAHLGGGQRAADPSDDSGKRGLRPLVIGVVHGLAGSAAVALLALTAVAHPAIGLLYLVVFGLGTVAGMAAVTTAIALPSAYAASRMKRMQRGLRLVAGVLSIGFGAMLAWEITVENGFFTATPTWSPR